MANAYHDAKGWIAQFRGLNQASGDRAARVRVPPERYAKLIDLEDQRQLARNYAEACEASCRLLEGPHASADVANAVALRAITDEQARGLLAGGQPTRNERKGVTLEQAYMAHPSSQREEQKIRWRYLQRLEKFREWANISTLDQVTLAQFQAYRDLLANQGKPWDTRRHEMLPIRRAVRMAATFGLPDVLTGIRRLDSQGPRPVIKAWSLDEIAKALVILDKAEDWRACAAISMGAIIGQRPSETIRVRCGDLRKDNRLPYGILPGRAKDAKNHPSRRLIPIPPTVAGWMRRAADGRRSEAPLLVTSPGFQPEEGGPNKAAQAFTPETFTKWIAKPLERLTGQKLTAKCLRKTFATWTRREKIDAEHRELFMGHETELAHGITGRHYTADLHEVLADEIAPTAKLLERHLRRAMDKARKTLERTATPTATPKRKPLKAKGRA